MTAEAPAADRRVPAPARGREAGGGAAVDRITRTMSLALGVGAAVFSLLALPAYLTQYASVSPVWSWAAAVSIFAPLLAAAALSRVASPRLLRWLAAACAIGHLGALLTLLPALPGGLLASDLGSPWLLGVSVIGAAAAAVAWPPRVTWPYVVVCTVVLGLDRWAASDYPIADLAFQDALHTLLFDTVFTALALATRRAGEKLDAAADVAAHETRVAATADARRRERSRIEALVHDSVLVALLASARGTDRAPAEARSALHRLDDVETPPPSGPLSAREWAWRVQALATEIAPTARVSHALDEEATVPAEAADAVLEATAEALRNSVRHAGTASRAVHLRATVHEIEVTVLDDGPGFDLSRVGPARLGIAVGILDRMRAVAGGRADIVSRPGVGTRISVGWRASGWQVS